MITILEQLEKPLFYPFWAKIKFLKNWVCQLLDFNIIYIMQKNRKQLMSGNKNTAKLKLWKTDLEKNKH